jgi:hypothetical protein|nr:MAG TPA: hypothetical protein [Podoviridae sp. ctgHy19]
MNDREQFTILDAMTIVSFMIGLANYGENVDQSAMSKIVQGAVDDIHRHLADQDEKLSKLLTKLEVT